MGCSSTITPFTSLLPLHHCHHHPKPLQISSYSQTSLTRRSLLFLSTSISLPTPLSLATNEQPLSPSPTPPPPPPPPPSTTLPPPDTTITDRVYMDFSLCPTAFRSERTLGDAFTTCDSVEPLGRVVFGLYGKLLPITVSNFKSMCTGSSGSSYKGTLVQKIFPGRYFMAGKQGRKDKGEVYPPTNLLRNTETVDSKSFILEHSRAGLLSLCLSENDDEDDVKLDPNYRNVEFLVTTGPGPSPQLDSGNIVFGTVLEGLDIVTAIAAIPTYKPDESIRQFNDLAEFFGDERAQNARNIWNRPLKTVYISDCGGLAVPKPSLSPSLP